MPDRSAPSTFDGDGDAGVIGGSIGGPFGRAGALESPRVREARRAWLLVLSLSERS